MKISKKLLSLLLAVVMLVSVFSINALAVVPTIGAAEDGKVNVKVTVEKETGVIVDAMNGGSYDGSAGDLYAVKTYVQCTVGLPYLYFPVHYNKDHFQLITAIVDNGDGTYYTYYGDETYNSDMGGETGLYMYEKPEYMQYTGNYNANGVAVTAALQQKVYGLGSTKATGYAEEVVSIDPSHAQYKNWVGNLASNVGIVKLGFDAYTSKHAYLNTKIGSDIGVITSSDYIQLATLYFQRVSGVSEDDVIGDEFGAYDANSGIYDNFVDATGPYYTKPSISTLPMTYTNAVVEVSAPSYDYGVEYMKDQIRFDVKDGAYAGTFDYRVLAQLTNFADEAEVVEYVDEAGFVFNIGSEIDVDTAKAQIESDTAGYTIVRTAYVSTSHADADFVMACLVKDIPDADKGETLYTLGYIKLYDGTVITFPAVVESTFSNGVDGLYDTYYSQAFPA